MASNNDLRHDIIQVSSELFMKQSYAATSIKQIAKAAGCTTAALYYYFEDGKDGILREVIVYSMPELMQLLEPLRDASSLYELALSLGQTSLAHGAEVLLRTRWLMVEFPQLGPEERTRLHQILGEFQRGLADRIERFVASREEAEMFAWILFCALFGYGQLFITLDMASYHEPLGAKYIQTLADIMGRFGE